MRTDGLSFAWTRRPRDILSGRLFCQPRQWGQGRRRADWRLSFCPTGLYPTSPVQTGGHRGAIFLELRRQLRRGGWRYLVPMLDWKIRMFWAKASPLPLCLSGPTSGVMTCPITLMLPALPSSQSFTPAPGIPNRDLPGLNSTVTIWPSWISDYPSCTGSACGSSCPQTCAPATPIHGVRGTSGNMGILTGRVAIRMCLTHHNQFIQMFVVATPMRHALCAGRSDGLLGSRRKEGSRALRHRQLGYFHHQLVVQRNFECGYSPSGDYATFAGTNGTVTLATSLSATALLSAPVVIL